jgi:DNA-binding transcriptional LysR family regulator
MDVHGRDLRYFVAVAEDLHFTRAAERLFVSQPALSKQIRMLEKQLGAELFVRNRRGVELTAAGAALLPAARRLLAEWNDAWAGVQQVITDESQNLTIGMSTSPGRGGLLPAIRSRFRSELPDVGLTVRQVGWNDPTAGLADESSDVAFIWLPLSGSERYRSITVACEPCVVAMPDTHHLATRTTLRVADLEHEPLLALPKTAGPLRDHWLLTDFHDSPALIGAEVSSAEETYEALVDGRGIVVLAHGNEPLLVRDGITTRPLDDGPAGQLALAWRKDDRRPAVAHYVHACRQVVQNRAAAASKEPVVHA